MTKFPIKSIILIAFATAILLVIFFVWATFRNVQLVIGESRKINASSEVQHLVDNIHLHLEAEEIAADNFTSSPNDSLFSMYNSAAARLLSDTDALKKIAFYDTSGIEETAMLKKLISKKIGQTEEAINLYKKNGAAGLRGFDSTIREKESLANARALLDFLENKNRNLVMQSGLYQEKIAQNTSKQFLVLAFIFTALLVSLFFIISNALKQQQRTAEKLVYQASVINSIPDAIISTDANYIITSWNKYAEEMYGFTPVEAIGKKVGNLIRLELSNEKFESTLAELNQQGYYKDEYTAVKKNNEPIFILASVIAEKNINGHIEGYVAIHRDISERKVQEKNLKTFNTELAQEVKAKTAEISKLLDRITDGFLALDSNFTFTYVNARAGEILGYQPNDMIGKDLFTGFPEAVTSTPFNEACLNAYKKQQYIFFENHYTPLNIWIENNIYPSPDGLSVFFKDITFKKKAELALKESELQYRHLIEHIHAGVVVHRSDTSIILCNQEASRLLGLSFDQMNEKKAEDPEWIFFSAEGVPLKIEDYPVMKVLSTGSPLKNVIAGIENPKNKNRTWLLINAFPEFDSSMEIKQVVVTFVDITDRKKAEEELKEREDALNKAQSMAKIGNWEFNLLTKEAKWSKELYKIFELENYEGDSLYQAYRNKYKPEYLVILDELIKRSVETGKGYVIEHQILCNDGSLKTILGIGETVKDSSGKVTGLKGTAQDVTEIKKTEERLQKSYEEIRQLATHLQNIREEERKNMSREIHDELGQQLTGLNMYVSWLNKKIQTQDPEIKQKFLSTLELIEDTVRSVRKISTKLRPSMLDDLGLIAAMEWQSIEFEKRSGIKTEFYNLTGSRNIPAELATGLFRIFQESLTNVARHAEAKKVITTLEIKDDQLFLNITDDGKGFILNEIGSKKTLGLFGMQERTMVMGGSYEIKTSPGNGTIVSIIVPLKKQAV